MLCKFVVVRYEFDDITAVKATQYENIQCGRRRWHKHQLEHGQSKRDHSDVEHTKRPQ